eukprot:3511149-Rhodomonas_salina.1
MKLEDKQYIDAHHLGNNSRFCNHRCGAGTGEVQRWVDGEGFSRIGIFASPDIEEGEEVVYNYNEVDSEPLGFECKCGSTVKNSGVLCISKQQHAKGTQQDSATSSAAQGGQTSGTCSEGAFTASDRQQPSTMRTGTQDRGGFRSSESDSDEATSRVGSLTPEGSDTEAANLEERGRRRARAQPGTRKRPLSGPIAGRRVKRDGTGWVQDSYRPEIADLPYYFQLGPKCIKRLHETLAGRLRSEGLEVLAREGAADSVHGAIM